MQLFTKILQLSVRFNYELLPMNEIINSARYCVQLDVLKAAIEVKRSGLVNILIHEVVFHQDDARPNVAKIEGIF